MFSTGLTARTRILYRRLIRESLLCTDQRVRTYLCDRIRREFRLGKETPNAAAEALDRIRAANEGQWVFVEFLGLAYGRRGAVRDELVGRIAEHAKPLYRTLVEAQVGRKSLKPTILPQQELTWIRERNFCRKHAESIWKSIKPPIPGAWRLALENGARTGYDGNELPRKVRERIDDAGRKGATNDEVEARKLHYQTVLEKVPVLMKGTPPTVSEEDANAFTYLSMVPQSSQRANPYSDPDLPVEGNGEENGLQSSTAWKNTQFSSILKSSEPSPGLKVFREALALGPNVMVGRSPFCKSEIAASTSNRIVVKDIHKWGLPEVTDARKGKGTTPLAKKIPKTSGNGKFQFVLGLPVGEPAEIQMQREGNPRP